MLYLLLNKIYMLKKQNEKNQSIKNRTNLVILFKKFIFFSVAISYQLFKTHQKQTNQNRKLTLP